IPMKGKPGSILRSIGGDMLTMCPYPCFSICGKHILAHINVPLELTSLIKSYLKNSKRQRNEKEKNRQDLFIGVSTMSFHHKAPALLIKISILEEETQLAQTHTSHPIKSSTAYRPNFFNVSSIILSTD
ncbi:MAG: hypothetical protein NXI00_22645, partial [Cytophagales bacterium]|nr:hypothetical protein [Cytophagales bacterium]